MLDHGKQWDETERPEFAWSYCITNFFLLANGAWTSNKPIENMILNGNILDGFILPHERTVSLFPLAMYVVRLVSRQNY